MPLTLSSRKARNRLAILEAARALLVAHGFHGAGLDRVATEAGLTRRTIYSHFQSKADLLVALVDQVHEAEQSPTFTRKIERAPSALARLDLVVDATAAYLAKIEPFARMLRAARVSEPAAERAYRHRMRDRHRFSADLAKRLRREGALARDLTVSEADHLIWMLMSFDVYELLVVEARWSPEQYRRSLKRLLHAALVG